MTTRGLAEKLAISKRQAERMVKEGVTPDQIDDVASIKLRKLRAEAAKIEEQIAILRRENVPASRVRESAHKAGAELQSALDRLDSDLASALAGKEAAEVRTTWQGIKKKLLADFCAALEKIA